jgi:hypothetical protein
MTKRVSVGEAEYLEPADYERFGRFPQEAMDSLLGDAIGYQAHWAGYTVSIKSAQEITVSPGRYFEGDIVYSADDSESINLITFFPLAASDEKWLALILRGEEVAITDSRSFETSEDPETSVPVAQETPVVIWRKARLVIQQGVATPAPAARPVIAETDACIAFVRVTTLGIQEIVPGAQWRVKTLAELDGRVTSLELRVAQLFEDTETIRTDVANLAAAIGTIPDPRLMTQIVRDTSRLVQWSNLPEEARNYWFDQALVPDNWDFTQGGFFRINEGVRFQYAAQRDHTLRLLDSGMTGIKMWENRLLLPDYEEVTRISSPTGTGRKDIANSVHTVTTATKKKKSHQRIRYGETISICENRAGWESANLKDRRPGEVFKHEGEEWIHRGLNDDPWNNLPESENGHKGIYLQKVIKETVTQTYTVYDTETFGLSGAIHGETFPVAQLMVATSIDINLTRVGETGDITLCICDVTPSSAPDYDSVIARVTKPRSQLVNGWNKFSFEPTLLEQGKRYAWFVVTTGNHQLMTNSGNAFPGGTMFVSTDGGWSQGNVNEDFTFRLNAARFKASRTVIPFESLTLEGGMTEIEMVYQAWEPAITKLVWEVRAQGDTEWIPMDARENNPLANLPPLVQLRLVMVGTEDIAPAIDLTPFARAIAGRMRTDLRAITRLFPFGFTTTSAQIVLYMDEFDANRHTTAPKLILADGTVVEPTAVVTQQDQTKPSRMKYVANFAGLPAGTAAARVRVDATTNSVIHVPFVQDIQLNAF